MSKLINLTDINSDNFIEMLKDSDIIVYENIQGTKIFFNFDENQELTVKARSVTNDPINRIDLALQKYYNKIFNYLEALDERAKKLIPSDWWFCCEYFYDTQPAHINYDYVPSNNLILTNIYKGDMYTFDLEEIVEYSNLLGIDYLPILFKGKLTEKQLELLNYYLKTSTEDLEYIFGDDNFVSFFYKMLNTSMNNSVLMKDGNFQDNIDKIIIRIDNDSEMCLSILNPLYKKTDNKNSEHVDIYTILLMDFLEFLESLNIERTFLKSKFGDDLYIEMISNLFNNYCEEREDKILNYEFSIPPFFYEDKFKINLDMITNTQTRYLIEKSDKLEYMFKILLNSFRNKKKKPIGVFNDATIDIFNKMVNSIQSHIDKLLKIEREEILKQDNLLDFEHFYDIQYPKDAAGDVYPDLYKDLDVEGGFDAKKKKKVIGKKKPGGLSSDLF